MHVCVCVCARVRACASAHTFAIGVEADAWLQRAVVLTAAGDRVQCRLQLGWVAVAAVSQPRRARGRLAQGLVQAIGGALGTGSV